MNATTSPTCFYKNVFALGFLMLLCAIVKGQNKVAKLDSLRNQFIKDSIYIFRPKNVFPLLASDQRNSFINGNAVNIWGAKAGITLYDRHNMGIGGYFLNTTARHYVARIDRTLNQTMNLQYLTTFYEYSFIEKRWWEVGMPVEIGLGNYIINNTDANTGKVLPTRKGWVLPFGTGLDINFKPTKWFALNVIGGYRFAVADNPHLNLSGWYYSFGGTVYVRQILQDFRFFNKKRNYKKQLEIINRLAD